MGTPLIPPYIVEKISDVFGSAIRYPADCERLSLDIQQKVAEIVGVTTLKRLFGFVADVKQPRLATLDILAKYAGYPNYDIMIESLAENGDSGFDEIVDIIPTTLKAGDKITFEYLPDRKVSVVFTGNFKFQVVESEKSGLQLGDILTIMHFSLNLPLIINSVERKGVTMGKYIAGKVSGLTSLTLEPSA